MAVKRSKSASRVLAVFETIARDQPIGVSALSRLLAADKSAVQRDIMTLADAGWIRSHPGTGAQWELSPHFLTLARPPKSAETLRLGAAPILEQLRSASGETAYLAVPDRDRFVVIAAAESHHLLRIVPAVGIVIPMSGSATARAISPYLDGGEDDPGNREIREHGYAVNDEEVHPGAVAIASAVLGSDGRPAASLVLTGPAQRLPVGRREELGLMLRDAARELSLKIA